jgi:sialate O-acetylesterase
MKTHILKIFAIAGFMFMFINWNISASDYRILINLAGSWKFNLGDNMKWADPAFNDKDWDKIHVPASWESQGYVGYDGFAWYRKKVVIPGIIDNEMLFLCIKNVDDADEVYFNGELIGGLGKFPPSYETAYGWDRKYIIPSALIKKDAENLIAVRVYDGGGDGGIVDNIGIFMDENEELLNLDLSGDWKFKLFNNKLWKNLDYNDSDWSVIKVPMTWESQGYFNHDGYAWYRKAFELPTDLVNKKLFLILGKIDDYDDVYLNGEEIGNASMLENHFHSFFHWGNNGYNSDYWLLRRVYEIPKKVIKTGKNTIAVRVYDFEGAGGIYEGPIGIMDQDNLNLYEERFHRDENPVQSFFDWLFD